MKNKSKKIKMLKKQIQGITLIALVVTVIVLLILAGVAINLTVGDNGLFKRAQNAADTWQMAEEKEQSELKNMESFINGYKYNIDIPQVEDENAGVLEEVDSNILEIRSIEDLVAFSYNVKNGNEYDGKTIRLAYNLDFNSDKSYVDSMRTDYEEYGYEGPLKVSLTTGEGFNPIGSQDGKNCFYGTFDGNNQVICSLYIKRVSEEALKAGLFARTYGTIQNLGLIDINIEAETQSEQASLAVGGITAEGYNANIYNSYVTGDIKAIGKYWMQTGGLCGNMLEEGNIENCYNLASIECKNIKREDGNADLSCGGIVGQGEININKCFNEGNLNANGGSNQIFIGGICGFPKVGIIKNSYNCAKIEMTSETSKECYIGGIGGMSSSSNIMYCYNSGQIIGEAKDLFIGGIIARQGDRNVTINNAFNIGEITINNQNVNAAGGIIGQVASEEWHADINNSYNLGKINVENPTTIRVGSIAGNSWSNTISFHNCYYLVGTYEKGLGYGDDTGIIELQDINDFPTVLEVVNGEDAFLEDRENKNDGYPLLRM